jgi:hypothetical protein
MSFVLAAKLLFGRLWALLRTVPWQAWAMLGILLAGWLYGLHEYHRGVAAEVARSEARERVLQKRIDALNARSAVVTERIVTQYRDRVRTIRERGATIVKEVPTYVPLDASPLPGGFRVLHDAAAAGVLPDPAAIPYAAPVPAQTAAATVADNYATCAENAARQSALIAWWAEQAKLGQ